MKPEIDWDSVFAGLPDIMGLPKLRLRGRTWVGPYRIDGTGHHRWDKMCIKQGLRDKMPLIMEQGGESMTLWSWLVQYGKLRNDEVRAVCMGIKRSHIVFDDDEYYGPTKYVESWQYLEQGGLSQSWSCPLFAFLSHFYGVGKVQDAFKRYNVSTGLKHPITGVLGTRFWYKNRKGQILHDKTMFYAEDGHRLKNCPPMRKYKKKWGYRAECLFGEDSIVPGKPIFVVESEKTAIICYLEYPQYNWVATGGMNNMKSVEGIGVSGGGVSGSGGGGGVDVWLVPDIDGFEQWSKFGKVWRWWERCGMDIGDKWDIADFILAKKNK